MSEGLRLNRFLALAGIASRRESDRIIFDGRVTLNGSICLEPGSRVGDGDHVKVDGKRVQPRRFETILFNKPRGFVCSKADELGRETIFALLPGSLHHLNHVGRLDLDSEGLLVLTNDGDLARSLSHPSKKIEKEYHVTLDRAVDDETLDRLLRGIHVEGVRLAAKAALRLSQRRVIVILDRGAKRQIRVMFQTLGFRVTRLLRVRIGSFGDDNLAPGTWRRLEPDEIERLLKNPQSLRKESRRRHGR